MKDFPGPAGGRFQHMAVELSALPWYRMGMAEGTSEAPLKSHVYKLTEGKSSHETECSGEETGRGWEK